MLSRIIEMKPITLAVIASCFLAQPVFAANAENVGFTTEVVPALTKLGCNAGGCHGKAEGQNGFKLSLFGFEPQDDYEYIVKEARGRRLFLAAPAQSLLLLKGTGAVPHAGGKRLDPKSDAYAVLLRWIAEGAKPSPANQPSLERIEIQPGSKILARDASVQLAVIAHFRDGSKRDITRFAVLESGVPDLLTVDGAGLAAAKQRGGSATVTARYMDAVAVARITIPFGTQVAKLPPAKTVADELVFKQLKELGLPPSELCDDSTFIRRATIDICGRLPTKDETEAFLADKSETKYEKLVDRLLATPEYADYFANKWSALLRNRRNTANEDAKPNIAFHAWIRDSIKDNKPFDKFTRELLTASGVVEEAPQAIWYRELKDPANLAEDVAQLFLGQRVACAKCHHHPNDRWTQGDYWSLAAAFALTEVRLATPPKKGDPKKNIPDMPGKPLTVALKTGKPTMPHPRTNVKLAPAGLDGKLFEIEADADPREQLAAWVTATDNPYFARTFVNRYWKHFFARGLVDPEDDMRATNPASNPELLDALTKQFVADKYDMKKLVRLICTSNVYRLSSAPNERNADDRQHFARFYPRRLNAEVLLDAIDVVALAKTPFRGVPAGTRAVQLPDNQSDSYFLSVFGRPDGASACECERNGDANLAQALLLMNS